jgi:hypothetical protein
MKAEYFSNKKQKLLIPSLKIQVFPEPFIRDKVIRGI